MDQANRMSLDDFFTILPLVKGCYLDRIVGADVVRFRRGGVEVGALSAVLEYTQGYLLPTSSWRQVGELLGLSASDASAIMAASDGDDEAPVAVRERMMVIAGDSVAAGMEILSRGAPKGVALDESDLRMPLGLFLGS